MMIKRHITKARNYQGHKRAKKGGKLDSLLFALLLQGLSNKRDEGRSQNPQEHSKPDKSGAPQHLSIKIVTVIDGTVSGQRWIPFFDCGRQAVSSITHPQKGMFQANLDSVGCDTNSPRDIGIFAGVSQ
jgi:hypothetical protein